MLYVFGHDLAELGGTQALQALARNVELLVFQGPNINATSEAAHVVLPSAVYAEKDGTFTNCQGRIQRIHQAFPPLGQAKPDWQILFELAKRMDILWGFQDAASVFKNLAAHEPAFANLSYESLGDDGDRLRD